jgi:hypothetical protein
MMTIFELLFKLFLLLVVFSVVQQYYFKNELPTDEGRPFLPHYGGLDSPDIKAEVIQSDGTRMVSLYDKPGDTAEQKAERLALRERYAVLMHKFVEAVGPIRVSELLEHEKKCHSDEDTPDFDEDYENYVEVEEEKTI